MEVVVFSERRSNDEVRGGGIEEEALDDSDLAGLLRKVDI